MRTIGNQMALLRRIMGVWNETPNNPPAEHDPIYPSGYESLRG
jgi:hypothetical protein